MRGSPPRLIRLVPVALSAFVLAACSEGTLLVHGAKTIARENDGPPGHYKVGNPYQINGIWYYPAVDYEYVETGIASWYGPGFHGNRTANGEIFDQNLVSAAHRTLPMPSMVRVTNLENGRSIVVRMNDRGPFARGRIIDMSRRGAQLLGFYREGTARVRVEILADESRQLAAAYGIGDGAAQVARAGTADTPPVTAAPRVAVTEAPIDGAAPAPSGNSAGSQARSQAPVAATRAPAPEIQQAALTEPEVRQGAAEPANMYIQAGAFAEYDNANRLRARLSVLGPTQVSQVQIGEQLLFRVRVGPIQDLKTADTMLDRVIGAGYRDARLVVDR